MPTEALDARMDRVSVQVSLREFAALTTQVAVLNTKLDALLRMQTTLDDLGGRVSVLETAGGQCIVEGGVVVPDHRSHLGNPPRHHRHGNLAQRLPRATCPPPSNLTEH